MSDFMYEWIEDENSYCVFDDMGEPILETLEFLQSERNSGAEPNTLMNKALALRLWFEFLDQEGMHYSNVDNKYISLFRDWLKTPPEYRDMYKNIMQQKEHISSATWMQYQERVTAFYGRYVLLKYPECKITWKIKLPEGKWKSQQTHEYMFKEKIEATAPDTKSMSPEVFKEIRVQSTNKRNTLIFDLTYVAGLRRGELFNIDCRQFDAVDRSEPFFEMIIHDSFNERPDKQTKTGGRSVYISSSLAEEIGSYVLHDRETNKNEHYEIFTAMRDVGETKVGDPLTGVYVSKLFKEAAIKAGHPKCTIHDCRHSATTNWFSMGVDQKMIMDQLGHKSPNTTNIYRSKHAKASASLNKSNDDILNIIRS